MNTTTTQTWTGDWQSRIKLRMQANGHETVASFLRANPNEPLFKIARTLGPDVAAVQLAIMYFDEALAQNALKPAARDLLCRVLHGNLRKGWNGGMHSNRMMAGAYSEWLSTMEFRSGTAELRRFAEQAWNALEKSDPSTGWLPSGVDDNRIVEAIDYGWENQ